MESLDSIFKYFFPIVVVLQFFGCDLYNDNYVVYEPTPVDPSTETIASPEPAAVRDLDCSELIRYKYNGFYETLEEGKPFTLNTPSKKESIRVSEVPVIKSRDFASVAKTYDAMGNPSIHVTFTENGKLAFKEFTGQNINKKIAVIIGDKLIAAPKILATITGGSVEISGNFTQNEVDELYYTIDALIYCKD